jgi:hypothetical protein
MEEKKRSGSEEPVSSEPQPSRAEKSKRRRRRVSPEAIRARKREKREFSKSPSVRLTSAIPWGVL